MVILNGILTFRSLYIIQEEIKIVTDFERMKIHAVIPTVTKKRTEVLPQNN